MSLVCREGRVLRWSPPGLHPAGGYTRLSLPGAPACCLHRSVRLGLAPVIGGRTLERNSLFPLPLHNEPDALLCPEGVGASLAEPQKSHLITKNLEGRGLEKFELCGEKE